MSWKYIKDGYSKNSNVTRCHPLVSADGQYLSCHEIFLGISASDQLKCIKSLITENIFKICPTLYSSQCLLMVQHYMVIGDLQAECWYTVEHIPHIMHVNPDSKVYGPTLGPPGSDSTQVGPMYLALWAVKTLLCLTVTCHQSILPIHFKINSLPQQHSWDCLKPVSNKSACPVP